MEAKSKSNFAAGGRIIEEPTEPEPPTPGSPAIAISEGKPIKENQKK